MRLWRISSYSSLEGLGGEYTDGRWHTAEVGKRIVYMAEHPSLALIESLVNLAGKPQFLPDTYQLLEIDIESTSWKGRKFLVDKHAHVFDRNLAFNESQSIGDSWLKEKRTALAVVPSAPSPFSWNILFNPLHRHARSVRVANSYSLAYDEQLFKASPPNTIHLPLQIERKKRP